MSLETSLAIWLVHTLIIGWCCFFGGYLIGVHSERKRWRKMKIKILMDPVANMCPECDGERVVALGSGAQVYFGPCPRCHPERYNVVEGHQDEE